MKRLMLFLLLGLLCAGTLVSAEDDIEDLLFSGVGLKRNTQEGLTGLITDAAVELKAKPADYRLLWMYACLNYFQGEFYSVTAEDKKKYFTLCKDYADKAVKANPQGIAGHYWLGVGLAKWAEANGVLYSLFSADDILNEMDAVIRLNPKYFKGLPYAIRASVYGMAPGVISVGDNAKARADIQSALLYGKDYRSNYLIVGDVYIGWSEWDNALKVIDDGLALTYDARLPLEEGDCIKKLKERRIKVEAEIVKAVKSKK